MRSASEQSSSPTGHAGPAGLARPAGQPGSQAPAPYGTLPKPGLRERKKAKTRAAIRRHALRLFREQGYHATTIEQIAEAAEVSPSTFFRYFPTKEDVVLQDDLDVLMFEAFEAQPPELGPIAAIRAAMRLVFDHLSADDLEQFRESTALSLSVPEVRARAFDEFATGIQAIAAAIAQRAGRAEDDFAVRNLAGAIIGVVMSATLTAAAADPGAADIFEPIDSALAHLEAGLPI
jgi:AcrR family transcriptional regulator